MLHNNNKNFSTVLFIKDSRKKLRLQDIKYFYF